MLRAELAGLLGTQPERIALTSSTTEGCNIVLRGLGIGPGDEVVTTDSEHPGLFGGLVASGATLRIAAIRERPTAEILPAIQAQITPRTRLIAISHVSWLNGAVLPVRELAGHGVPVLVDGAQGAGAIPVMSRNSAPTTTRCRHRSGCSGRQRLGRSMSPRISLTTAASRSRPTSHGSFPTTSSATEPFASKARGLQPRRSPGSKLRSHSQQRPETTALRAPAEAAERCRALLLEHGADVSPSLTKRLWSPGEPRSRRPSSTGWPSRALSYVTFQAPAWFARLAATGRAMTTSNDSFEGFRSH